MENRACCIVLAHTHAIQSLLNNTLLMNDAVAMHSFLSSDSTLLKTRPGPSIDLQAYNLAGSRSVLKGNSQHNDNLPGSP